METRSLLVMLMLLAASSLGEETNRAALSDASKVSATSDVTASPENFTPPGSRQTASTKRAVSMAEFITGKDNLTQVQDNNSGDYRSKFNFSDSKLYTLIQDIWKRMSSQNFTDTLKNGVKDLSLKAKDYLQSTSLQELREEARTSWTIPQTGFFSSLVGLNSDLTSSATFFLFLGWPLLLALLYVALVVLYPNRRSDNYFEQGVISMADKFSYTMHAAEDSFLDFMEDITEPQDSYTSGSHFRPAYAFPDPQNRQEVFYKPTAFYDEDGQNYDAEYDYDYGEDPKFDAWGNPIEPSSTFVNTQGGVLNPVSSFQPALSEPLREKLEGGDISNVGGGFDLQNEIAQKDRHNFLNVVLGTQYQHSKRPGSLTDQGIVQGTVLSDLGNHPEPPKRYRPSEFTSSLSTHSSESVSPFSFPSPFSLDRFEADLDPRQKEKLRDFSGFRPSRLEDPNSEEDWVARPKPFKRQGEPASDESDLEEQSIRFPPEIGSRLKHRGGSSEE